MKSLFLIILLVTFEAAAKPHLPILGWVEQVQLDGRLSLQGKLDSGAKTTSLHVEQVTFYRIDNEPWARFHFFQQGKKYEFRKKVVRLASIKNKFSNQDLRPVIEMEISLCGTARQVEVNLSNRKGYNYRLLIGRNYLAGNYLIDTQQTHLAIKNCPKKVRTGGNKL